MTLGTVLIIIALVLAVVSCFVTDYYHRLLAAAVVLIAIGVLIGVGDLGVRTT